MEHKTVSFDVKEVDLTTGVFSGYASVFGNVDSYGDIVVQGAFAKTIQERGHRVKICWQHDWLTPIGKPTEIREDDHGLFVVGKISDTTTGRDALTLMRDGVVTELSFGYDIVKHEWVEIEDGKSVHYLKELRLYEISPVTIAANPAAVITGVKDVTLDDLRNMAPLELLTVGAELVDRMTDEELGQSELSADELKAALENTLQKLTAAAEPQVDDALTAQNDLERRRKLIELRANVLRSA